SLIYSTAPPPAVAAAARKGLALLREEDWRREHLFALIARFRAGCERLAVDVGPPHAVRQTPHAATPIQPLVLGSEARALAMSEALWQRGYLVTAIRPPTVPAGSARLRITITAGHDEGQVDGLLDALAEALATESNRSCVV
ncbi:MAG: aminotransferase class I/II-fold pyridoxal phosphate-dependent enzyme, partial [Salinisphaera sp.]|nr:aminotransferase class I/II-fold pyridoxal phosphate-dependent enzyme [Salinisphaera sp.]